MSDRILLDFEGDRREIADYEAAGGYESLKRALKMEATDIVGMVDKSGLRGRGGAGFPTGRHEVCVCTSLACTLVGAADTLRAFERELGVEAGGSSEDGLFTLRTVECYGGCGWGPVVAVDERYHEPLPANEVPQLIEKLRAESGG